MGAPPPTLTRHLLCLPNVMNLTPHIDHLTLKPHLPKNYLTPQKMTPLFHNTSTLHSRKFLCLHIPQTPLPQPFQYSIRASHSPTILTLKSRFPAEKYFKDSQIIYRKFETQYFKSTQSVQVNWSLQTISFSSSKKVKMNIVCGVPLFY